MGRWAPWVFTVNGKQPMSAWAGESDSPGRWEARDAYRPPLAGAMTAGPAVEVRPAIQTFVSYQ